MGLVYDTASAHVIQVVKKMDVSPYIISIKIDLNSPNQLPPTTQDPYYLNLNDKVYQLKIKG